jgi:hypothetical protein
MCSAVLLGGSVLIFSAGAANAADGFSGLYKPRPGPYDPLGIPVASFYVFPRIGVDAIYDDNVYADNANKRSDELFLISPQLDVESNWSRHALQLSAGGEFGLHSDFTSEDYTDYHVDGRFRGDISYATKVLLLLGQRRDHQLRGDPEDVSGLTPTKYDTTEARGQINQAFGRFQASVGGRFLRRNFHDVEAVGGGLIDNSDRDGDVVTADARLAYEFSPGYSAYAEFSYNWRMFDNRIDKFGRAQDSEGYQAIVGVLFELTDLLEGELYGGYMRQDPDAPALLAISGPAFGASLEWSPSELTMVRLNAERSIQDSFLAATSSGYFSDRVRLSVSHKLRQNIDVTAYGEIGQDKYTGIDRTDHRYGGGISVGYNLNRHFTAKLAYSYETRRADYLIIQDYSRNRVAVALEARY